MRIGGGSLKLNVWIRDFLDDKVYVSVHTYNIWFSNGYLSVYLNVLEPIEFVNLICYVNWDYMESYNESSHVKIVSWSLSHLEEKKNLGSKQV